MRRQRRFNGSAFSIFLTLFFKASSQEAFRRANGNLSFIQKHYKKIPPNE